MYLNFPRNIQVLAKNIIYTINRSPVDRITDPQPQTPHASIIDENQQLTRSMLYMVDILHGSSSDKDMTSLILIANFISLPFYNSTNLVLVLLHM